MKKSMINQPYQASEASFNGQELHAYMDQLLTQYNQIHELVLAKVSNKTIATLVNSMKNNARDLSLLDQAEIQNTPGVLAVLGKDIRKIKKLNDGKALQYAERLAENEAQQLTQRNRDNSSDDHYVKVQPSLARANTIAKNIMDHAHLTMADNLVRSMFIAHAQGIKNQLLAHYSDKTSQAKIKAAFDPYRIQKRQKVAVVLGKEKPFNETMQGDMKDILSSFETMVDNLVKDCAAPYTILGVADLIKPVSANFAADVAKLSAKQNNNNNNVVNPAVVNSSFHYSQNRNNGEVHTEFNPYVDHELSHDRFDASKYV